MNAQTHQFEAHEDSALPVPRASIEMLEAKRRAALLAFGEAYDSLHEAMKLWDETVLVGSKAADRYMSDEMIRELTRGSGSPESRAQFIEMTRKRLDSALWRHILEVTDLERLMDRTARKEFMDILEKDPPEATAENAYSTLTNLVASAHDIFLRGTALAFSSLDRRFRSHDGFKLGSKIIIDYAFDDMGSWNYHNGKRDTLRDVERAFHELDGKRMPEAYAGIVGAIDDARRELSYGPHAYEAFSPYFRAKIFKNGNLHLYFRRDDLVVEVNKVLAEYYGEVLAESADAAAPAAAEKNSTKPRTDLAHAPNFDYFPTSASVAERIFNHGGITTIDPGTAVLEPSAGDGALVKAAIEAGALPADIVAVEIQRDKADTIRSLGLGSVLEKDFLHVSPDDIGQFDIVVMNPPFSKGRDCDHVLHAMEFVKPGGTLVAIMSAGVEYRTDKRTKALHKKVSEWKTIGWGNDPWRDLPAGSFSDVGTNINTVMLAIRRPE